MATEEMSRGQWQARIGSEIFGTYYEMLIGQNPAIGFEVWKNALPDRRGRKPRGRIVKNL